MEQPFKLTSTNLTVYALSEEKMSIQAQLTQLSQYKTLQHAAILYESISQLDVFPNSIALELKEAISTKDLDQIILLSSQIMSLVDELLKKYG